MDLDAKICYCFHVSRRKLVNFVRRESPKVPSQLSECGGAGTGCGWCVPFLKVLFEQCKSGEPNPDLPFSVEEYARRRQTYRDTGERPPDAEDTANKAPD